MGGEGQRMGTRDVEGEERSEREERGRGGRVGRGVIIGRGVGWEMVFFFLKRKPH
ncbi:hypothetical protein AGMMS50229_09840 [Campylobacterota bacterium]|nr:hypothetical protein AGMMS50229_09840 [Campylobacterota bacterium]